MRDFLPVELPPGVVQKPTKASNSASWRGANFIRWDNGIMRPLGGWAKVDYVPPNTQFRDVYTWVDNSGKEWTAYLTEDDVFVDYLGTLTSINPTPPLQTLAAALLPGGYGKYLYGYSTYGTPRPVDPSIAGFGPSFKLGNWGENLIAMTSVDGRLLQWVPTSPPQPMTVVPNAPTGCRTFVVVPERYVQVFQANGLANQMAWCDEENISNWNFADVDSRAGSREIEPSAPLLTAIHTSSLTLFFTTKAAYTSAFIGLPYIFNVNEVADSSVPVSSKAIARTTEGTTWVSKSGWWVFNGSTVVGIVCELWDWIVDQIDWDVARQTAVLVNVADRSELWFSFPSQGSAVNDKTVIFSYKEIWWSPNLIGRMAGVSSDYSSDQVMTSGTFVYHHEEGNAYTDSADRPWAESFNIAVDGGGSFATFRQMQPEVEGSYASLMWSVSYRNVRTPDVDLYTPPRQMYNGTVDIMQAGRDFRFRVDDAGTGVNDWTIGVVLVDIVKRGKKS